MQHSFSIEHTQSPFNHIKASAMNSDIEIYSDSDQDYRRPSTFGKKGGGGSSFRRAPSDELDEIEDLGTPPGGEVEEDDEEEAPRLRPQKGGGGKGSGSKNRTGGGGASTSGFTNASRLNVRKGTGSTVAKPGARRFVVDEDSDEEHDDTPAFKPVKLKKNPTVLLRGNVKHTRDDGFRH